MPLIIILFIFSINNTYASLFPQEDCVSYCMNKYKISHIKSPTLDDLCTKKEKNPNDYAVLKKELENLNVSPYGILNSKETMHLYCTKVKEEKISKCIKRVCARRK